MDNSTYKKVAILGVLLLIVGLFFYFDLGRFLSLDYLKQSQARFQTHSAAL